MISVIRMSPPVWELAVTEAAVALSMLTDSILTLTRGLIVAEGEGESVEVGVELVEGVAGTVGLVSTAFGNKGKFCPNRTTAETVSTVATTMATTKAIFNFMVFA